MASWVLVTWSAWCRKDVLGSGMDVFDKEYKKVMLSHQNFKMGVCRRSRMMLKRFSSRSAVLMPPAQASLRAIYALCISKLARQLGSSQS
jgi:hypothetical protein